MSEQKTAQIPSPNYLVHDVSAYEACVPCEAANQCCEFYGIIEDAKNLSRKISWPYCESLDEPNASTRLFVIADQVKDGNTLFAEVNIKRMGAECRQSRPNHISYLIADQDSSRFDSSRRIDSLPVTMEGRGIWTLLNGTTAYIDWVPRQTLLSLMILDMIMTFDQRLSGSGSTRVTPQLCGNHLPSVTPFQVIPFPKLELSGTIRWALLFTLNTTRPYVSWEVEETPSEFKLIYANHTQILSEQDKTSGSSETLGQSGAVPSGFFGLLDELVKKVSGVQHSDTDSSNGNSRNRQRARKNRFRQETQNTQSVNNTHGSRVTFSLSADTGVNGLELKAKDGTPDLEFNLAEFFANFKLGVTGTLDVVQAAVAIFAPGAAMVINKARANIANGKKVNGDLQANLIFAGKSELKLTASPGTLTLHATPPDADTRTSLNQQLKAKLEGTLKALAKAELSFHVESEVWGVSAKAGAYGSLHTAWTYQFRTQSDSQGQFENRNYFEGLKAEVRMYAKIREREKNDSSTGVGVDLEEETQADLINTNQTLFTRVEANQAEAASTEEAFINQPIETIRHDRLTPEEAKQVLREYDLGGNLGRLSELERLETSLSYFPNETDNQIAMDNLLEQISEDYHRRFSRDSLGLHEILAPSHYPITEEYPEWTPFKIFGGSNEI